MDFLFARFLLYSVQCDCMPVHVRDGVPLLQACVRTKFVCGGVDFGRATVVTLQLFFFTAALAYRCAGNGRAVCAECW